jgi:phenylacetate-CoA ligase
MSESAFLRERFVNPFTEVQEIAFLAYGCSEFYKEKLRQAKLQPEEIRSIADLSRLPLTTREEIQGKPWGLLTVPKSRICQIDASTPSSKLPRVYIPLSDNDLYRDGLRPFIRGTSFSPPLPMTIGRKDLVINALPYEVSYLGFLFHRILQDGVGAGVVPVGKGGFYSVPEKSLRIMKDLSGDHLFTTPAYAIYLADKAREVGYEIGRDLKPKSLWLVGESCAPALRKRIEELWKTNAYLCLSSLECGPIALECGEKDGMHLATGYVFVEIVPMDNDDLRLSKEAGEIVVTVLWRRSSPLIRYRTGLIGSLDLTPCACGLESPRIRFWGDKTEFLELGKCNVSLLKLEDCLTELPELSLWYYLKAHGDVLTILVPPGMSPQETEGLKENTEKKLRERLELPLRVEVEEHSLTYMGEHWNRVLTS